MIFRTWWWPPKLKYFFKLKTNIFITLKLIFLKIFIKNLGVNKMMKGKLSQIECDPACGFMVRSHDEREALDLSMRHAKRAHPEMKVSEADLKKMMKTV